MPDTTSATTTPVASLAPKVATTTPKPSTVQKVESELKSIVAEAESTASGLLGTISPQWTKFAALWKSWSLQKKIIGSIVIIGVGIVLWAFSVDLSRLVLGSYRSAYTYGRGLEVDPSEVKGDIALALKGVPSQAAFDALTARVAKIEAASKSNAPAAPSRITTGSIPKKKTAPKTGLASYLNF